MAHAFEGNDLYFGQDTERRGQPLVLPSHHRDQHLYVCGASRTGKSKFLEHLIRQDISNRWKTGCGMMLIDWHGRLYDDLLRWLAWDDLEMELPVLLIDLRRDEDVVGYNLLRHRGPAAYPSVVVNTIVTDAAYVWGQSGTDQTPRFARIMNLILRVLYKHQLSFIDSKHLITRNMTALKRAMTEAMDDSDIREEWRFLNILKPDKLDALLESTVNRLWRFNQNALMQSMFGQTKASLDFRTALDQGWIILVSLGHGEGKADGEDAETMATLLLSDLWSAAQDRGKGTVEAGKAPTPFYVYLDEFQRFVTPTLAENLDEAGGFGLQMTMAHQFPTQMLDRGDAGQKVYNSVMANAGTKVVLRTNHLGDLDALAKQLFMGVMDPDEIKLILRATRVLDYEEETRTVVSETTGGSEGESESRSTPDASDNISTFNERRSETNSSTESWSRVTTEQTSLRPVMGKEMASVQFRPLEEQLHRAMQKINTLKRRQCFVRLAESDRPVAFRTPDVADAFDEPDRVEQYRKTTLAQWPFVLPAAEARARLDNRFNELQQRFLVAPHAAETEDDPADYRRPIK